MKKSLLLIDGDEIVYKAGFASQSVEHHIIDMNGKTVLVAPNKTSAIELLGEHSDEALEIEKVVKPKGEDAARHSLYAVMNTILADTKPTDYRLYLTGDGNFRYDIATLLPYKGNRKADRPYYYDFIRHMLHNEYWAITVDGMEADDALSITQWHHERNDTNWTTIIASQDKDLKMVPGLHYNPSKREQYSMDWIEARFSFYCQLLAGDQSVDNIPGIYRVGMPTAAKKLRSVKNGSNADIYRVVYKEYIKAQETDKIRSHMPGDLWGEDRIKEVGRLLWMLQEKGQLWMPGEDYYAGLG